MKQYYIYPTKNHSTGRLYTEHESGDKVIFRGFKTRNGDCTGTVFALDASDGWLSNDSRNVIVRIDDGQEFWNRDREWEVSNNTFVVVQSHNLRIPRELNMWVLPRSEWRDIDGNPVKEFENSQNAI